MSPRNHQRLALLFDIDGTLIITGGAGARSWRLAFDELYGIPADISKFTDTGMTDPNVGRKTFEAVLSRKPERHEFARILERRLHYLRRTVNESGHYRVLPGVEDLLSGLVDEGYLLGLITGNLEAAAHIKLHRANLNRFFSLRRLRLGLQRPRRNNRHCAAPGLPDLRRRLEPGPLPGHRRHSARRGRRACGRGRLRRGGQPQVQLRPARRGQGRLGCRVP